MTTAEPATEVRAIPTYIAIPASKVLGEGLVVVPVEGVVAVVQYQLPVRPVVSAPEGIEALLGASAATALHLEQV